MPIRCSYRNNQQVNMHTLSIPCLLVVQIKFWMSKLLEIESILFLRRTRRTKRKAIVTNHSLTQKWDEQQQQQAACSTRPRRHRFLLELQSLHSPNQSNPGGQSASVEQNKTKTKQASNKGETKIWGHRPALPRASSSSSSQEREASGRRILSSKGGSIWQRRQVREEQEEEGTGQTRECA